MVWRLLFLDYGITVSPVLRECPFDGSFCWFCGNDNVKVAFTWAWDQFYWLQQTWVFSTFFYSWSLKNVNKRPTVVHLYSNVEQGKEIHKFISTAGITVEISVKKNNLNRKKLYQQLDECGKNK